MHIPEEDDTIVTQKNKRQMFTKFFGNDFIVYLVEDTPTTIREAYSFPDADLWKKVVRSEMDSIMSNGTWEVVDRPYGCQPTGYKWIFKKKLRSDGTIERYKARLVAKGYTQKHRAAAVRRQFSSALIVFLTRADFFFPAERSSLSSTT
jgi:hypothetical protein